MTIKTIRVFENWFSKSITIDGNGETFESSVSRLKMLLLRTRSLGHRDFACYLEKIDELFNLSRDIELVAHGSEGMYSFAVRGDGLADEICWEALPIRFRSGLSESRYIPVRMGPAASSTPSSLDGSLRILALVGHSGAARAYTVNQIKELIEGVLRTLSPAVRSCVANPTQLTTIDMANDDRDTWAASMTGCNPHLVLFFGHGEGKPEPRIKTTKSEWLSLDDLFDALVGKGNRIPPFWLLIACSLADHDADETVTNRAPLPLHKMGTRGALAVVAMRHEVRVTTAKLFLSEFLRAFLCGASMEVAAAGGRRAARLSKYGSARGKWDWAVPAVWSFREPVQSLYWPAFAATGPTVETALRLLRATTGDPTLGVEIESVDADGLQPSPAEPFIQLAVPRVRGWIRERRIKLIASEAYGPGHIAQCSAILDLARRQFDRCPLLIRPSPGRHSFGSRLRKWAEDLQTHLIPSHDDLALVDALQQVARGDEDGLRSLLALPGLFAIFLDAPEADDLSWELFEAAPPDCVIAVCHSEDQPDVPSASWYRDSFSEEEISVQLVEQVISACPRTMAILTVLRQPVKVSELRNLSGEAPSDLLRAPLLRIEPASGVILADSARHRISSMVGADARIQAHMDIVDYLSREGRLAFDWDALLLIEHLAGAARWKELADAVNVYADGEAVNWVGLGDTLTKARSAFFAIKPRILLEIARSLIDRQELLTAHVWLELIESNSLLEKAWQHALLSEACKGLTFEGASEEMWRHAREAIRLCEEELVAEPTSHNAREALHRNQLQLARLELYFNHTAESARKEFERLINTWRDASEPDTRHALAAAKRNLAECLFEFPPFANDAACRKVAEAELLQAQLICRESGFAELGCDIEYSLAKLAEREGDYPSAIRHLKLCSRDAWNTGYTLVRRIADARIYWTSVRRMDEPFSLASFQAIQRPLEFLEDHAWAARYAITSRLWAALCLANLGNRAPAVLLLTKNLRKYAEHRSLKSATDVKNLARCCAGLLLLDEDGAVQHVWGDVITQALRHEQQDYRELFEGDD